MKKSLCILYFIILGIIPLWSAAQNVDVKVSADTNILLIGDHANIFIDVTAPRTSLIVFPNLFDTIIKEFEILERSGIDTLMTDAINVHLRQKYTVTSFDSGMYMLPPFNVLNFRDTLVDTLRSDSLFMAVLTMQLDTTNAIFDIKKPYETPWTFNEFWHNNKEIILISAGGLILLIVAIFILRYYLRRKKKDQPVLRISKPKQPPHAIALSQLNALKDKKLWQKGALKEYHSELTEIIRVYIEARYDIYAMEMTSYEILEAIKSTGIVKPEVWQGLSQLLTTADFVKFAKASPLPDENDNSMRNAINFVEMTKLVKVTETEQEKSEESSAFGEEDEFKVKTDKEIE